MPYSLLSSYCVTKSTMLNMFLSVSRDVQIHIEIPLSFYIFFLDVLHVRTDGCNTFH